MSNEYLLEIKNLRTYFYIRGYVAKAVDNVSLTIHPGETLGLVLVRLGQHWLTSWQRGGSGY